MSRYLLDTDIVIMALQGRAEDQDFIRQLTRDGVGLSLITYGELYEGIILGRDPRARQLDLRRFLKGKRILPLNRRIMERFAIIRGALTRNQRQQIGDMDLLIAATALEHGLTLVTRNRRDFAIVPGLPVLPDTAEAS